MGGLPGSGDINSRMNQYVWPAIATTAQLAGLGIAANRGALGAPLVALGEMINQRNRVGYQRRVAQEFPEGSPERINAESAAAEGGLDPELLRTLRSDMASRGALLMMPQILAGVSGETQIPRFLPAGFSPEYAVATGMPSPPETYSERRTFQRQPTTTEALTRAAQTPDEQTRSALVKLLMGTRLPSEPTIPAEVKEAQERAALAGLVLQGGRVKTPEEAEQFATTATLANMRMTPESFLEPRPRPETPGEHLRTQLDQREVDFQKRLDSGEFDLSTAAGLRGAANAALAAGARQTSAELRRQIRIYREEQGEAAGETFRETTAPQLRRGIDALGKMRGATPADVEALHRALDVVEANPTQRNVDNFTQAMGRMPQAFAQRQQAESRIETTRQGLDQARQRFEQARAEGNIAKAERILQSEISEADRQITLLYRQAEFAPEQVKSSLQIKISGLEQQRNVLQRELHEMYLSRRTGIEAPPPAPRPATSPRPNLGMEQPGSPERAQRLIESGDTRKR